jgi:hypothetical protein
MPAHKVCFPTRFPFFGLLLRVVLPHAVLVHGLGWGVGCVEHLHLHKPILIITSVVFSRDKLVDILYRIERFFHRLEIYAGITPTAAMMDMIVKIMVEVLTILGIAT